MVYKLISTEGEQTFELRSGAPLVVGRALNSDIPVFDPTISRKHAEVALDDDGVHVTDLGSSNGTFLNGARIDAARLSPGDVITFGKVAFRLKESLGTRANILTRLIEVFRASEKGFRRKNPAYIVFTCRTSPEEEPIKLGVPFRSFDAEIDEGLNRAGLYKDMPRGRKRAGWKKEFLATISEAAKDLGELSDEEIQRTIRNYREERRVPEITVAAEI